MQPCARRGTIHLRPIFGVENPAGVLTELLCQNDYERLLAQVAFTFAKNEDRKSIGEASRRPRRDEWEVKDIAVQLGQLSVIRARHDNIWVIHCQTGQQVAAVTRGLTQQCGGGVGQHHHWHSLRSAHPKRVAETGAEDRFAVENMLKHSH